MHQWQDDELNLKAKVVCKPCNETWMSQLEGETKPILKDVILRGQQTTLRERDIALVAAVAFKNTVVADHMHTRGPFFTLRERRDFRYTRLIPTGVQMWLGSIAEQRGLFKSMYAKLPRRDSRSFQLNIFTYAVGHLVVQTVTSRYQRKNDRRHAPPLYVTQDRNWNQVSLPFWPSDGTPITWPPAAHMGNNIVDTFVKRWKSLVLGPGLR